MNFLIFQVILLINPDFNSQFYNIFLYELYQLIKEFTDKNNSAKKGILSKLKEIKIQAFTDFSVNFDNYSYQQESKIVKIKSQGINSLSNS